MKFNRGDICKTVEAYIETCLNADQHFIPKYRDIPVGTICEILGPWKGGDNFYFCWCPTLEVYIASYWKRLAKI